MLHESEQDGGMAVFEEINKNNTLIKHEGEVGSIDNRRKVYVLLTVLFKKKKKL